MAKRDKRDAILFVVLLGVWLLIRWIEPSWSFIGGFVGLTIFAWLRLFWQD